jgi:hypothetical protein
MSEPRADERERPWYREVWPWLLMLPPAASVAGGVMMVVLATGTPAALVVDDYSRIEALTSERFERDVRATELGLVARIDFLAAPARVEVRLESAGYFELPRTLRLILRHATNPAADRTVDLGDAGGALAAPVDLLPGRYRIELLPPDSSWRLAGDLARPDGRHELRPQLASPDGVRRAPHGAGH